MYYLLEDNRIIDSEQKDYYFSVDSGLLYVKRKIGTSFSEDGWRDLYEITTTPLGKIKKQSENVYGLIEEGDLLFVPFYWNNILISRFDVFKRYEYSCFHCCNNSFREKQIYAIYKPNEKGDYIKMWEVKEDE